MEASHAIVIGASSGGVAAIVAIAKGLARPSPAAVLVVQHIGANASVLPELLRKESAQDAVHPRDGEIPQPGRIYIAPPDRHMLIEGDRIRLNDGPKENHTRPAIDPLFRSAAFHWGERAIGVVLTGHLDDGTAGLRSIKQCGGRTIVQAPANADEPSMPLNAMRGAGVDYCLRLEHIAPTLNRLAGGCAVDDRPGADQAPQRHDVATAGSVMALMEGLLDFAPTTGLSCPDCNGRLYYVGQMPLRYRCRAGHAFSPDKLSSAQNLSTEHVLRSGVRSLRQKESLLRRLAQVSRSCGQVLEAHIGEQRAQEAASQAMALTRLIEEGGARSG